MAYSATAVKDWDSDKPVGASESVSILDDALREIKKCVENDLVLEADIAVLVPAAVPGLVIRPKFTYKDADEIYIEPFVYYHNGTTEQLLYCDTKLTFQFQNLAASDWSYLYLDDSAIVTADTNLIATGQFVDAVTEPAWDVTDHSQMSGHDRCVFAVRTNGSSQILEFFHDGDTVFFADEIENQAAVDIDMTFTDIGALILPKFTTLGIVFLSASSAANWHWRTNGQAGTVGHQILQTNARSNVIDVITDSNHIIEIKNSVSDGTTILCRTQGWKFPIGM